MTILDKLKLLVKVRQPVSELIGQASQFKRGHRTYSFWFTLVGSLVGLASALTGFLPPVAGLILVTSLTVIYNILAGLRKADEVGTRPLLQTTEFWVSALNSIGNGLLAAKTGGISPEWLGTAQTIITGAVATAQNLSGNSPSSPNGPAPVKEPS